MGKIREEKNRGARPSYVRAALRVLYEYDEPTLAEIKREMCYRGFCPRAQCENIGGKKQGEDCGHVLATRLLALKARHALLDE